MPDVILDPFHRRLAQVINVQLDDLKEKLAHGAAMPTVGDVTSVAEKYAAAVSVIQAYETVLEMCKMIETEQNTVQPRAARVAVNER